MSQTITNELQDPYYSRVDNWQVAARVDPVIWSDDRSCGPWDDGQLATYEQDGFLSLPGLFSQETASQLLAEANQLAVLADPDSPEVIAEPESQVVRSIFRLHQTNDMFRKLCHHPQLVEAARKLLGGDVYIHQSRINYKPAFEGKEFFWHSDFETWHIEDGMPRMRAVSVSISLTETNDFNGPLILVPGSHKTYIRCAGETPENHFEESLRKQEIGVPSREAMSMLVEQGGMVAPTGVPGSVLFFECNTMHGSAGNISPMPRTNLFLVFNSVENALVEPFGGLAARPDYLAERSPKPIE